MLVFFILTQLVLFANVRDQKLDLTPYNYPRIQGFLKDKYYQVAIFATNDLHGFVLPKDKTNKYTQETYEIFGMEYLTSYVSILQRQWGNRFMWLDAGDEFQGGYETKLSKGRLMTDIFNKIGLTAGTFGNHEFDDGIDRLRELANAASFPYITSNIYLKGTENNKIMTNQIPYKTFRIGKVKIGVVGITTIESPITTKGDLSSFTFKNYPSLVIYYSKLAKRKDKADAIVLLSHAGINCKNINEITDIYKLQLWDMYNSKNICEGEGEIIKLINELPSNIVDLVIAGHTHQISHFFFNGIPVVSSLSNGRYANVAYLSFDKRKYKLLNDKTLIEGPLPVCSKIYSKNKICDFSIKQDVDYGTLESFKFHGVEFGKNPKTSDIVNRYLEQMGNFQTKVIMTTSQPLSMNRYQENVLGNLASDFVRSLTKADVAILNYGFFRTTWNAGSITLKDVNEMFPFSNQIVSFEMTGEELTKLIKTIQSGTKNFYQTSGIKQYFKQGTYELTKLLLFDGTPIDNSKTYKIGAIDFLMPLYGDDFSSVKSWYQPRGLVEFGDFTEQAVAYFENLKVVDNSRFYDENNKRINYE